MFLALTHGFHGTGLSAALTNSGMTRNVLSRIKQCGQLPAEIRSGGDSSHFVDCIINPYSQLRYPILASQWFSTRNYAALSVLPCEIWNSASPLLRLHDMIGSSRFCSWKQGFPRCHCIAFVGMGSTYLSFSTILG